jgi:prepilin-type processing-associated H-X9-DG protein
MKKKTIVIVFICAAVLATGTLVLLHLLVASARPVGGSPQQRCGRNLKQIGLAIEMYESDSGWWPSTFHDLGRYVSFQSKLFVCPVTGAKPGEFADVNRWTSYTYVPSAPTSSPAVVAAYCDPTHHGGSGAMVLFVDGHTEWFSTDAFEQLREKHNLK